MSDQWNKLREAFRESRLSIAYAREAIDIAIGENQLDELASEMAASAQQLASLQRDNEALRGENRSLKNQHEFDDGHNKDLQEALLESDKQNDSLRQQLAEAKAEVESEKRLVYIQADMMKVQAQRLAAWKQCAVALHASLLNVQRHKGLLRGEQEALATFDKLTMEEPAP